MTVTMTSLTWDEFLSLCKCFTQQHWKTLQSPGTSSISSAESSKSTISVDTDMSELSDKEAVIQVPKQLNTLGEQPQGIPIPDGFSKFP